MHPALLGASIVHAAPTAWSGCTFACVEKTGRRMPAGSPEIYLRASQAFWTPAPRLARLVAEGKTFTGQA